MNEGPVNILMVDDDDLEAELLRRAFARRQIINPLHWARDGVEGLEKLREFCSLPVLVLLDLNMPRMNGFEFLDKVRGDPILHSTVVFVLTTSDDDRDKLAAYDRCVAGFLVKSRMGSGFANLLDLLRDYCRAIDFPPNRAHGHA